MRTNAPRARKISRPWLRAHAILILLVLVVAGCGSPEDVGAPDAGDAETEPAAEATETGEPVGEEEMEETDEPAEEPESADDDVAALFEGETIEWVVTYEPGSTHDLHARIMAPHLSRLLPGNPDIEIRNLAGGAGLAGLEYVYTADPDGLTIGFFGATGPSEELFAPYSDAHGDIGDVQISDFEWLGSSGALTSLLWVHENTGLTSVDDIVNSDRELSAAATRPGSSTHSLVAVFRDVTGAPIEVITGYEVGAEMNLVVFREEVDMRAGGIGSYESALELGDVFVPIVTFGGELPPPVEEKLGLEGLPRIRDVADSESQALMNVALGPDEWGRLIAAPPGTPAPVVEAYRDAIGALNDDADFVADNDRDDLSPMHGADVEQLVEDYLASDEETVRRVLTLLEE